MTVVASLRQSDIFIPLNAPDDAVGPAHLRGKQDKNGNWWVDLYADKAALLRALPPGSTYGVMKFAEAFRMIAANDAIGGILINSGSDHPYVVLRESFSDIDRLLGSPRPLKS